MASGMESSRDMLCSYQESEGSCKYTSFDGSASIPSLGLLIIVDKL